MYYYAGDFSPAVHACARGLGASVTDGKYSPYAHTGMRKHAIDVIWRKRGLTDGVGTAGCLSFHPILQCVVHALKGLA